MRVALSLAASLFASLATASAGVVVIDPANGPGTDYTSITSYLLATPANGDVLLLRSGTYSGGVVSVLSLSFVADAGATVKFVNNGTGVFGGHALMVGANGGGAALVRGIEFSTPAEGGVPLGVIGLDAPNSFVFVEECTVPTAGSNGATFGNAGRTAISRCSFRGAVANETGGSSGYGIEGKPGAIVSKGRLAVFGSEFVGGRGLNAGLYSGEPLDAMAGAPGVMTLDGTSALKAFASVFQQQRFRLGAHHGCFQAHDLADHVACARVGVVLLEIARHPPFQVDGLAHIQHLVLGIEIPVHTG